MDCPLPIARSFLASHTDVHIEPWLQTGFSGAAIWQVQTAEGTYCLRRWPEEGLPPVRIRTLHHFLRDLANRGIDVVPVPVVAEDGSTLLWHDLAWWQLEPWMPGRADYSKVPTDERLRNIMHVVADIHCAAAQHEPQPEGREWFAGPLRAPSPNGEERLRLLRDRDAARTAALMQKLSMLPDAELQTIAAEVLLLYGQLRDGVALQVAEPFSRPLPLQVCLRDLWHDHVLLSGDDVTGIIDLSAARWDHVATDLARLLGSLVGDDHLRREQALDWYEERRPLSAEDRQLVVLFDRSAVLLSGLLWVERITSSGVPPENREAVAGRLRKFRDRMQTLADAG
ncbi:Spore coat protein I [Maioricimonas rarisocia]|uniref:Spore coat protein I n=1 Tax=Maioricimonas rarisocia TaxID=2528026 RepID=A0A517Z6P3_9PLAN|nr:phosphotransferase [Maioricimonas rarisocia]QDU38170.1 Spore coat protein I [Maioricimonas rarisocia]